MLEEPEYIYGLKENDLRKLIRDVTAGMSYLREKDIIHRDIKPGNILLSDKSDCSSWKLTDFGAARQLQPEQQFQVIKGGKRPSPLAQVESCINICARFEYD